MKLNPKKCMFRMQKGTFIGHVITTTGIEANLEKVKALCQNHNRNTSKFGEGKSITEGMDIEDGERHIELE